MLPAKPFYLIRHGETEANVANITAGGEFDSPLTAIGREQAQKVARYIDQLPKKPSKILHSPMSRARDTAHTLNEALDLLMHEVEDIKEHLVGEWSGKPWKEVMPILMGDAKPEGGESRSEFAERVRSAFTRELNNHEDPVMFVAHGGIFHSLFYLHRLENNDHWIHNCHLHYFEPYKDHAAFPWRVWQYDIEDEKLIQRSAPFCATQLLKIAS